MSELNVRDFLYMLKLPYFRNVVMALAALPDWRRQEIFDTILTADWRLIVGRLSDLPNKDMKMVFEIGLSPKCPPKDFEIMWQDPKDLNRCVSSKLGEDWEEVVCVVPIRRHCVRCGAPYAPMGHCSRREEGCQGGRGDG
jgi:hypothetical protein